MLTLSSMPPNDPLKSSRLSLSSLINFHKAFYLLTFVISAVGRVIDVVVGTIITTLPTVCNLDKPYQLPAVHSKLDLTTCGAQLHLLI